MFVDDGRSHMLAAASLKLIPSWQSRDRQHLLVKFDSVILVLALSLS